MRTFGAILILIIIGIPTALFMGIVFLVGMVAFSPIWLPNAVIELIDWAVGVLKWR